MQSGCRPTPPVSLPRTRACTQPTSHVFELHFADFCEQVVRDKEILIIKALGGGQNTNNNENRHRIINTRRYVGVWQWWWRVYRRRGWG